ncbi:MAG: ATP-binding protein [Candidatus Binataceae bacterium]
MLTSLAEQIEKTQSHRRALGGALRCEREAFNRALSAEEASEAALGDAERKIIRELATTTEELVSKLAKEGISALLGDLRGNDARKAASWLDTEDETVSEIFDLLDNLATKRASLGKFIGKEPSSPSGNRQSMPLQMVGPFLRQRSQELDAWSSEVHRWNAYLESLRLRLSDCASPRESKALAQLDEEVLIVLLRRSQIDEELEPLAPLLFRLLEETGMYDSLRDLLFDFLCRADTGDDVDLVQEAVSYLSKDEAHRLLSDRDERIARLLVLATFRESIARQEPFFFLDIWGYEGGWSDRARVVGERLHRLFAALHKLYWRTQNFASVLQALIDVSAKRTTDEILEALESSRRQTADNLADRLENPTNMRGHFFHLRSIASVQFFKPLAPNVRNRDVRAVQVELIRLERAWKSGSLEDEVLKTFGGERDLRHDHLSSLRRYVETNLEELRKWVDQEVALTKAAHSSVAAIEEGQLDELRKSINHLPQSSEKAAYLRPEVGSIEWLEHRIAEVLASLRHGTWPQPTLAFFGELPSSDTLFQAPKGASASGASSAPWPSWLEPTPFSERSWVTHLRGALRWKDLLQDGIAKFIVGDRKSAIEIIESLIECGEFEAAFQAGSFPEFAGEEISARIAQAEDLLKKQQSLEKWCEDLDTRIRNLSSGEVPSALRPLLAQAEAALFDALACLDKAEIDQAGQKLQGLANNLSGLEQQIRASVDEQHRRLNHLREWAAAAGDNLPSHASVEDAEALVRRIQQREARRRRYLVRLSELDVTGVPESVRRAVRGVVRDTDRPDRWPDARTADELDIYIENLLNVTREWWSILRGLDERDVTFGKIQELANALAERLPLEIEAFASRHAPDAIALNLLFDLPQSTPSQYHLHFQERKLLQLPSLANEEPITVHPVLAPSEFSATDPLLTRIEEFLMQALPAVPSGSGKTVQDAYLTFGQGKYPEALELCQAAWLWTRNNGADKELTPLLAMAAWSGVQTHKLNYPGADLHALGLIFKNYPRILDRAHGLEQIHLLTWLLKALAPPGRAEATKGAPDELVSLLVELSDMPAGTEPRERFTNLIRVANTQLAEFLWESVRNLGDATRRGRTALLSLLHDVREERALNRLFEYSGTYRKYLSSLSALAARERSETSPKLRAAILQNYRTIAEGLRDRAFRDFAARIVARLQQGRSEVGLEVPKILEPHETPGCYSLVVQVVPDESDPPLSLLLELLPDPDFVCADFDRAAKEVTREQLLFEPRELEYVIRPRDERAASILTLHLKGETASGRTVDHVERFSVELATREEAFEPIAVDNLLEIYRGYDGRPVTVPAFVGRDEELAVLERCVARENPGAVVLYGARRLGKTSLLDELRRRHCVTSRKGSKTLFLVIPVDEFSLSEASRPFLDRFLKHIWSSILYDPKNRFFREMLAVSRVQHQKLELAGRLGEDFEGTSFLMRLRQYLSNIRNLCQGKVERVVLLFDEFDKLLEHYRKGSQQDVEELTNQLRRAATEEQDLGIIVAGSDLMRHLIDHPRNALYGSATVLQLKCFDEPGQRAAARLIVAPDGLNGRLKFNEQVLDDVIRITGGHPLFMRLVACAAAYLTRRRNVSRGTVVNAVTRLLRNEVLQGDLPDVPQLVRQPLQVIASLEPIDRVSANLLLLQLARHTTLERPLATWSTVVDRLLALRSHDAWLKVRHQLKDAALIVADDRGLWGLRYPILGERLRVNLEVEFERENAQLAALVGGRA